MAKGIGTNNNKGKDTKKATIILVSIMVFVCFLVIFYDFHVLFMANQNRKGFFESLGTGAMHMLTKPFSLNPFPEGAMLSAICIAAVFILIIIFAIVEMKLKKHDNLDTIAGDAKWMDEKELAQYNKEKTEPFGEPFAKGNGNSIISQNVFLSMNAKKTNRNLNMLCIGGSGTGKSFRFVGPNILQRNSSMVITDPSGGLYKEYGAFLEYYGYKVKCFNLDHMELSSHYNPFEYIKTDKDIEILVNMLISNTKSPDAKGGDEFWEKCEVALLCALISYLFHYRPKNEQTFSMVKDMIRRADIDENDSSGESAVDIIFQALKAEHPNCFAVTQYDTFRLGAGKTLKSILISCAVRLQAFDLEDIRNLTETDDIALDTIADEKTAIFIIIPTGETSFNFIAGLMYSQLFTRLYRYSENTAEFGQLIVDSDGEVIKTFRATDKDSSAFAKEIAEKYLEEIKTSAQIVKAKGYGLDDGSHNMDLYEIRLNDGKGETVCFRGDKKLAQQELEKIKKGSVMPTKALSNHGQRCPIHVRFLLDEFANTGKIPDFVQIISTIRKYEISTVIILQSLTQIQRLYDKEWETISANCDTFLYLGGGIDNTTTEWINKILGKKTVRGMNESFSKGGGSESFQRQSLDLFSMSQLRTLENNKCISVPRSCNPMLDDMYHTPEHPEWELHNELPSYKFNKERYKYIKEGNHDAELIDMLAKKHPEKETVTEKAYREEENEKAKQKADEIYANTDSETFENKYSALTEVDPVSEPQQTKNDVDNLIDDMVTEDDSAFNEPEEVFSFDFDGDMSFSEAPMA